MTDVIDLASARVKRQDVEISALKAEIARLRAGYDALRAWPLFHAPEQGSIQMWDPRWLQQVVYKAIGK